VPSVFPVPAAV
jgi:photosystem II oxygen-evolving enhancer protein 3